jgi:hypothetical protein
MTVRIFLSITIFSVQYFSITPLCGAQPFQGRLASLYMSKKPPPARSPSVFCPLSFLLLICITMVRIFKNLGVFGHVENM